MYVALHSYYIRVSRQYKTIFSFLNICRTLDVLDDFAAEIWTRYFFSLVYLFTNLFIYRFISYTMADIVPWATSTLITLFQSTRKGRTVILFYKTASGLFVFPHSFRNLNLSKDSIEFCSSVLDTMSSSFPQFLNFTLGVLVYLKTPWVTVFKDLPGCLLYFEQHICCSEEHLNFAWQIVEGFRDTLKVY